MEQNGMMECKDKIEMEVRRETEIESIVGRKE